VTHLNKKTADDGGWLVSQPHSLAGTVSRQAQRVALDGRYPQPW